MGQPLIRDEDGVRWITLNRPEILNALRLEDLRAIVGGVTSIDEGIKAIVLTGAGDRAFSAGMHLDTFVAASRDDGRAIITRVRDAVGAIRLAPVPTIAMLNG